MAERELLECGDRLRVDGEETDEWDSLNGTRSLQGTKVFLKEGDVAVADHPEGGDGEVGSLSLTGISVRANKGSREDAQVVASEDSIVERDEWENEEEATIDVIIEKEADNVDGGSEALDANGPKIADGDTYREEEEEEEKEEEEADEELDGDNRGNGGGSGDAELIKMTEGDTYEDEDDCNVDSNVDSEVENENTADGDT